MAKSLRVVSATLFCCIGVAKADDDFEQHDFLFLVEEAYTQEAGEPQIGFAFDYGFDNEAWAIAGEFEYGFTERLQAFIEIPFQNSPQNEFDIGNVEFGVDYALLKDRGPGSAPEVTIGIAAIAPVSDGEAESWRVEPSLRLAKNIIESVYLHASAAASAPGRIARQSPLICA